ncbi:anti-sigma factor [Ornithinibacillus bavariensis]|uniref:Anti-sigma-M factor YhdL n=1 Tax=Ornithinibacillus bavariensis TaxID=545502 RepID=A0A920C5R6_9BACI|nr:anti-sigma factor [Ornithinibacillus bavariensis]GIO25828.1 putative anti-sigma-M factor YhdL [Ornithinibacillus bavariensis]
MTDDFKRKLEDYEKGVLSESEMDEIEKELEKLETYQEYLEENTSEESTDYRMNEQKQRKILRLSKWKARFQTAFTALGILILLTIVSSVLTSVYYGWGKPDRSEVFRNIIDYTLTVTNPYGYYGSTDINVKPFFGLEANRDFKKVIGDENVVVGEMKVNYIFSLMGYPENEYYGRLSQEGPAFVFPGVEEAGSSDWDQLEKLPEGTVVSAYVSFSNLLDTEKVFQLFSQKNMELIWFAVDTGFEENDKFNEGIIHDPIGFPNFPIWHEDDMILESREESKGFIGGTVSESYSSPEYEEGNASLLHQQFYKTLNFLQEHEKKADKIIFGKLRLKDRIAYLEKNGIHHYGVVITGPTKEILTLKDEKWISNLVVDEVGFWNWGSWREEIE